MAPHLVHTSFQERSHLVHGQEVDERVEARVEGHAVDFLEVTEEEEFIPLHKVLVSQHDDGREAGWQVEYNIHDG